MLQLITTRWRLVSAVVIIVAVLVGALIQMRWNSWTYISAEQLAFSPDGQRLAAAADLIRMWSVSDGRLLQVFKQGQSASAQQQGQAGTIAWSPDGKLLAVGGGPDNNIYIWQTADGALIKTLTGHVGTVFSVAFSPDGTLLASASADRTVRLWRVDDATLVRTLDGHTSQVRTVAFSPDGQILASGSILPDGTVRLWEVSSGRQIHIFDYPITANGTRPTSIAFSPNGQWLAVGTGRFIHMIRMSDATNLYTITAYADTVNSIAFSPDSTLLASGGGEIDPEIEANGGKRDAAVRLWQVQDGHLVDTLATYRKPIVSVAFSPNGHTLASSGIWGDGIHVFEVK